MPKNVLKRNLKQLRQFVGELPELPNDDIDFDYSKFPIVSEVNTPTNNNGNGSFMDSQTAVPTLSCMEIELRKQLKVDDEAIVRVAVFSNPGEVTFGTWFYLTKEGIGISGNWSFETEKPETLNSVPGRGIRLLLLAS